MSVRGNSPRDFLIHFDTQERIMLPWRMVLAVGVALVLSGCWIVEIRPRAPIPVPQTLSDDEAE